MAVSLTESEQEGGNFSLVTAERNVPFVQFHKTAGKEQTDTTTRFFGVDSIFGTVEVGEDITLRFAWDTFSRRAFNCCEDMSDEMKNRYVEYLIERLENAELDNRVMKLVLEDLTKELSCSNQMLEKLNELQSLLEEERSSRKSLERENLKLKEQL